MEEQQYLADGDVAAFAGFLRTMVAEGHPGLLVRVGSGDRRKQVPTLLAALEAYSWRGDGYRVIERKLAAIRREMAAALGRCREAEGRAERRLAELELLFVATKALSLGQVYEGAFQFLIHQAETAVLSRNLCLAAALIDGEREDVDGFDDRPFRSDCAMTKVYAVMNRRTVVYDERLGAALGWLVRAQLEREGRHAVPEAVAFMVGERGDRRRDPSGNGFRFADKCSGREHARWNIRANWIVSGVAAHPEVAQAMGGSPQDRLRRIEAALFMIGDDVRDQPRGGASPPARVTRRRSPTSVIGGGHRPP